LPFVPLNVLHISESDAAGGAGRAAYKLHTGLNGLGHTSRMLVGRKVTDDTDIRPLKRNLLWRVLDRASGELFDLLSLQYVFYPSSFGVLADAWFRSASVVQLHNLHGSYFGFTALPAITRLRPVVWQLHDQWGLTGHVAYSLDCERWRHGCGKCPYLDEYPRLRNDTTAFLYRLKDRVYSNSRLNLVVPSRWMADIVNASPLLNRFPTHYIPTGIDTRVFKPGDRDEARRRLKLPLDRRIVFFAAANINERRKGLHLLAEALRRLEDPPLLLVAGNGTVARGIETRYLGAVVAEEVLADAYRAADVFAVPTLADVLTQTAPESIACGTPCVAFDRGGVVDVVRHLETGYQARFGDVEDFAQGLTTLLGDDELLTRLSRRCREVAETEFSVDRQVERYASLYEELGAEPATR
jgi:glycosyltransferase involved in cell wall biosynthesis